MYPGLPYIDAAPNSAELLLVSVTTLLAGAVLVKRSLAGLGARAVASLIMANVSHDTCFTMWRVRERNRIMCSWDHLAAVAESAFCPNV